MQNPTPMTLGNMRENGARSLLVTCSNVTCRHEKIVNVDAYGDNLFVPSFGPRMRCERCGQRGADVRPNWNETHEQAPIPRFKLMIEAATASRL